MRMDNAQRLQSHAQGLAVTPGDHRWRDAGALQQLEAVAVQGVETFERFASLGHVQTAIGQHTIDIEESDADTLGLEQQFRGEVQCRRHQITLARIRSLLFSAPHKRPSASTTSTLVMRRSSISSAASTANASAATVTGPACMS